MRTRTVILQKAKPQGFDPAALLFSGWGSMENNGYYQYYVSQCIMLRCLRSSRMLNHAL